jgi:hypothetical protein
MMYDDPEISTEEKRASLERYNYVHRSTIYPLNDLSSNATESPSYLPPTTTKEEEVRHPEEY